MAGLLYGFAPQSPHKIPAVAGGGVEIVAGIERPSEIVERVVDLLPIARDYYYNPSQNGSWSIKYVLPAICPDLHYSDLEGVQDGQMAISAYQEAIKPDTTPERKAEIHSQLDKYCALDTLAMVRLWEFFSGR